MVKSERYETIATYEIKKNWYVEVVADKMDGVYSIYMFHSEYGMKNLMFGVQMEDVQSQESLAELITNNVNPYMDFYRKEYMEEGLS